MRENHDLFQKNTALFPHLWQEFIDFERKIISLAEKMQLNLANFDIDHLAVNVKLCKDAEIWLTALLNCGKILSDNQVNGRVVYLIELAQPLTFAGQSVSVIELPFPKEKDYPHIGFEHIEIVMPFLANEDKSTWAQRILQQFCWQQNADLRLKISEPKVEGEQLPNPSIAVRLTDNKENHTCIKVHPYPIKQIIEGELK